MKPETTEMAALLASRLVLAEYIRRVRACQVEVCRLLIVLRILESHMMLLRHPEKIINYDLFYFILFCFIYLFLCVAFKS